MRPDAVKLFHPTIEYVLLDFYAVRRKELNILSDIPMHSLMPAIILWAARPAANDLDAQSNPPSRKACQTMQRSGQAKWWSIIDEDTVW
jgi:hypothetical protein